MLFSIENSFVFISLSNLVHMSLENICIVVSSNHKITISMSFKET